MLLAYEYENLLIDRKNHDVVARILQRLSHHDVITSEEREERRRLCEQLKAIGETKIYARLVRQ